jgi:simple sugar transport system substrate-binding protein
MAGDFAIFKGPIRDNKGAIVIADGTTHGQTDIALEKMGYLVEGVIGATA